MKPRLPIPEPIRGREPGTWAHNTIVQRLPEIGRRVIEENDYPDHTSARLEQLIRELPNSPIRRLEESDAPDSEAWQAFIEAHQGQNWLDVPWFFAETYFYRRILEATGYFGSGRGQQKDPFAHSKWAGLSASLGAAEALSEKAMVERKAHSGPDQLAWLLYADLWSNQADLSLWPAGGDGPSGQPSADQLLVDHVPTVLAHLKSAGAGCRVDFVLDNAGFELVADLVLADELIQSASAGEVILHLKAHPTFVSDATEEDLQLTIDYLSSASRPAVGHLAAQLRSHLSGGRMNLRGGFYWNSPLSGWEMPDDVRAGLADSDLVIVKGDANYRRLLGDRHWPFETPFADIMAYFPAPLLALRTLKGEIAAGLSKEQIASVQKADPNWLTDGKWGLMQFVP